MKNIRSHFWYTNSQRNGVFFLALIILGLQGLNYYIDQSEHKIFSFDSPEILAFQKEIDSLKALNQQELKSKIFPFNPSYLTDFKGYQLGMTPAEIDRLLAYRAQGKFINSIEQFQMVTAVSDSLLDQISPYFKFPAWLKDQKKKVKVSALDSKLTPIKANINNDLNLATALELQTIKGVGKILARRIVKFRERLGGYILEEQLFEVYGLKPEVAKMVLINFKIKSTPIIKKINLNAASFKELLSHVYVDYELCKKIMNYRREIEEFQSLEQLKNIEGFPLDKYDRIVLYLQLN